MRNIVEVLAGIGVLIGIYLFLSNADNTAKIVGSLGSQTYMGIKTLQGR